MLLFLQLFYIFLIFKKIEDRYKEYGMTQNYLEQAPLCSICHAGTVMSSLFGLLKKI